MTPENGWGENQKLVLFRLAEQAEKLNIIDERVQEIQISLALLKFKVGMIGAGAGMVMAAVLHFVLR